jgi:hypothetical protein
MKYSLRSLMLATLLGPPILAGIFFSLREAGVTEVILGACMALFLSLAAFDFIRGYCRLAKEVQKIELMLFFGESSAVGKDAKAQAMLARVLEKNSKGLARAPAPNSPKP